jgi:hypothetical protein
MDPVTAFLAQARQQDAATPEEADGGMPRLAAAVQAVQALLRDHDGRYLDRDCHIPAGPIQDALVDALTGPACQPPDLPEGDEAPGYITSFYNLWAPIILHPDGTLNTGAIARELADYSDLMSWASEVYSSVTRGRVSKPNTLPAAVIDMAAEATDDAIGQAIDDLIEDLEAREAGPYSTPEIVAAIREITGHPVPERDAAS